MKILVLNAEQTLFDGVVSEAILPGRGGELTIMDDHEQIFVALERGAIRLKAITQNSFFKKSRFSEDSQSTQIKPIFIQGGLARMKGNELIILVE